MSFACLHANNTRRARSRSCSTTALPDGARPQRAKLDLARDLNLTKGQVRDVPALGPRPSARAHRPAPIGDGATAALELELPPRDSVGTRF